MNHRLTLSDVSKLDMADRLMRACKLTTDGIARRVIAYAFPNSNARGDRWFDCMTVVESTDGVQDWETCSEHYELTGTRYQVGRQLARDVRDVANGFLS